MEQPCRGLHKKLATADTRAHRHQKQELVHSLSKAQTKCGRERRGDVVFDEFVSRVDRERFWSSFTFHRILSDAATTTK